MLILPDYIEVVLLGLFASVISIIITKKFGKIEELSQIKVDQHKINQMIKEARKSKDYQKVKDLSEQALQKSGDHFKVNIKPMVISFFIYIAILAVIWIFYAGWFLLYFVAVVGFNFLLKKVSKTL